MRKASDWFKNELRKEGGLDHFCHATILAMEYFNNELESQDLTEFMLERLRRIEQYMRLLENVSVILGFKFLLVFLKKFDCLFSSLSPDDLYERLESRISRSV